MWINSSVSGQILILILIALALKILLKDLIFFPLTTTNSKNNTNGQTNSRLLHNTSVELPFMTLYASYHNPDSRESYTHFSGDRGLERFNMVFPV